MHPNAALITRFYTAFQARDHATMADCYAADATFHDAVFTDLEGARIGAMWRMLCSRGTDLRVEFSAVQADDTAGQVHWEAWYTFQATGRPVHNVVEASFTFRDGRIALHHDRFGFWPWATQALGIPGRLLGWSGPVRNRVRSQAMHALERFEER